MDCVVDEVPFHKVMSHLKIIETEFFNRDHNNEKITVNGKWDSSLIEPNKSIQLIEKARVFLPKCYFVMNTYVVKWSH